MARPGADREGHRPPARGAAPRDLDRPRVRTARAPRRPAALRDRRPGPRAVRANDGGRRDRDRPLPPRDRRRARARGPRPTSTSRSCGCSASRTASLRFTKVDAVDADAVELAAEEARELVPGAEVLARERPDRRRASTSSGPHSQRVASVEHARADGPTRMYVDRSFSVPGFGTVVTGTLWSGGIGAGRPAAAPAVRPRRARPQRAGARPRRRSRRAGSTGRGEPSGGRARGSRPGRRARRAGRVPRLVPARCRPRGDRADRGRRPSSVHIGTEHSLARVVRIGERFAQLRLASPVVAARGDRVILRGETTLGGGTVLDPDPPRHRDERRLAQLERGDIAATISAPVRLDSLRFVVTGELHGLERAGPWVYSAAWLADLEAELRAQIALADEIDPGSSIPAEPWAAEIIPRLPFERRGSKALPPWRGGGAGRPRCGCGSTRGGAGRCRRSRRRRSRTTSSPASSRRTGVSSGWATAMRSERTRSAWPPTCCSRSVARRSGITLARFRDLVGTGRRDAQLLLERFDANGLTRRDGDRRVLRKRATSTQSR